MQFIVTEDALTDTLFHNSRLGAVGSGTKAEARAQARRMLAADALLEACKEALGFVANLRVPQTLSDAALQVFVQGRPVLESLCAAIALAEPPPETSR